MTKSVSLLLLIVALPAQIAAQQPPAEAATDEAVRRQEATLVLQHVLKEASAAEQAGELNRAARLYEDANVLVQKVATGIPKETSETVSGLVRVRMQLALKAQSKGNFEESNLDLSRVLAVDPRNGEALALKKENDKALFALRGKMPSKDVVAQVPEIAKQKIDAGTLAQDGKLLYEAGKIDESKDKLIAAIKLDPDNRMAYYYLSLIEELRYSRSAKLREITARDRALQVERAWSPAIQRDLLPVPNPFATTNLVNTGPGRRSIQNKLNRIILNEVLFDGLPLPQVIQYLSDESTKRDPDREGVNFLVNPNIVVAAPPPGGIDPNTGAPVPAPASEPMDMNSVIIRISPALRNVSLANVLEAVTRIADKPIRFSVEEYAVVFSQRPPDSVQLVTRRFKVNPNTFMEGLQAVGVFPLGNLIQSQNAGGGGGGGGGLGGGGGAGGQGGGGVFDIPRVYVSGGGQNAIGGGGGGGGAGGGGTGQGGIPGVTSTNLTQSVQDAVRAFFTAAGVNVLPPNMIFFNDRTGMLMARATPLELDIIQEAIETLNVAPPQVTIEAKFVELGQNDAKALGFDWFIGNTTFAGGRAGWQGGTAPSFNGANPPATIFPNPAIPQSSTDGLLTSGLRTATPDGKFSVPTIATVTGILTDPQFRVVIHALEQRDGTDLLSAPKVTTLSGRQTQIQVVEVRSIVVGNQNNTQAGGGGATATGLATGGAAATATINFQTASVPLGPTLDVVPYVSADGYSIQMTIIPQFTEFLGYDNQAAAQFVPQVIIGTGNTVGQPVTSQLPLPIFRVRSVVTSSVVWDGQTVVLGGLLSSTVAKSLDKVPIMGDLPLVGQLFRSQASLTSKKNLVIFVTPTIIDPAGNRVHTSDNLPYDPNSIPVQKPAVK